MSGKIEPMLAVASEPFDADDFVFEIKMDGIRGLAAVERRRWQLWGRGLVDYQSRYPEMEVLRRLPAGTVVDGELVVLRQGRADFPAVLRRHQLSDPLKIRQRSRISPVTFVLFDLLSYRSRNLMDQPLAERRARLAEIVGKADCPQLLFSDGISGSGRVFFEQVVGQGHEGVVAKHLASRYAPGRRVGDWRKIKPRHSTVCVIIGYREGAKQLHGLRGLRGLRSLLVAAEHQGSVQYVAEVTSGIDDQTSRQLAQKLPSLHRRNSVVPCRKRATWVRPELYCHVRYLGWTAGGRLRHASFGGLIA